MVIASIAVYFAILIGISYLSTRKGSSGADFFRGSHSSPWPVVAIAMVGTSISGVTFISVPGMVRVSAFSYLQMALGFIAGYAVIAYVLLPLYYRMNANSLYAWIGERFGGYTYKTAALFFILSKVLGCSVRMFLTASVLQLLVFDPLGVPFALNVLVSMFVVWLYTFRGGVKTLVWADMFQTLCMIAAVVLCIFFVGSSMGLDFRGLCSTVSSSPMSRVFFFDDVRDSRNFFKQFFAGMFTTIAMTGLDQDMMQKNLSCKSLKAARKNVLSYGSAFLPVNFLFLCLGVLLYAFAASKGIAIENPDDLFPTIACGRSADGTLLMPPVVGVTFVLGLVSSAFSSSGSALTALTTSFTVDFLKADRRQSEKRLARTRLIVHSAWALVLGVFILLFSSLKGSSVIDAVYTIAGYTYGPLLAIFGLGLFTRLRPREGWVPVICVISPLLSLMLSLNSERWLGGYRMGFELLIVNSIICFFLLFLSSIGRSRA